MGKINVLDEQLANQIAAGEVVERPSSVVKELVENAVDAGSTTIDIAIEEGGLSLVRVTDNGSGIEPDDIEKAFFRHATSKLASSKDLFRIASLGFRGEALPSIAAVAKVELISSPEATGLGKRLVIEGGSVKKLEDANAPQGTDIAVRDLFFNTPARLKYMKSIQTEIGHIADYANRLALAHPGIAFTLKHNGNTLLRTTGTGDILQAFAAIYGTTTAKSMLIVEGEHPDYDLRGYISRPELTRANRNGITIVVNGRYIKSYIINQAILQAYHTLLPINRFPMVVLDLKMHPSLLDVNVHPSKMEVRFSKEPELRQFIEETLGKALGRERHIPGPEPAKVERSKPVYVQDKISFHQPEPEFKLPSVGGAQVNSRFAESAFGKSSSTGSGGVNRDAALFGSRSESARHVPDWQNNRPALPKDVTERLYAPPSSGNTQGAQAVRETAAGTAFAAREREPLPITSVAGTEAPVQRPADSSPPSPAAYPIQKVEPERVTGLEDWADDFTDAATTADSPSAETGTGTAIEASRSEAAEAERNTTVEGSHSEVDDGHAAGSKKQAFPELYWIGQLHGTYIIAQNEEGLFLIDQHAAHERINYEYYLEKFGRPQQASQQLLVPMTLEFTQVEAAALTSKLDLLNQAGVELESFGANTFLVRSHPEWLPRGEEQEIIEEMTDWLLAERGKVDIGKLREKSAIMCSCKASIKANDRLTREEGEGLLRRLAACNQPYTCPHGRPIVVHMTTYQLEKMFKRVMS
ncbi:DNA mismatch repair protein MutL [Paenibacillus phyllosphaerae]|uniref:DNA mismatch repair protein MutL n=1 Tax=Paenibacillus phyllosphaerae TaxID=274593 RepID=A0A7W5FMS5_9BACL|nr:DNA mismatch repair endonuclease MutL [Paenibacillus phyllosphaerae]MBB3110382.1 DNA mismatch repair protein MutL [Paenibacillus phyllosphaerae]